MMRFRHKKCKQIYIGITAVIYMVFFTAQLSYKFHICANFPLLSNKAGSVLKLSAPRDLELPNIDRKQVLSLDKRFELVQIFALVTPEFRIAQRYLAYQNESPAYHKNYIHSVTSFHTLRGPPAI